MRYIDFFVGRLIGFGNSGIREFGSMKTGGNQSFFRPDKQLSEFLANHFTTETEFSNPARQSRSKKI